MNTARNSSDCQETSAVGVAPIVNMGQIVTPIVIEPKEEPTTQESSQGCYQGGIGGSGFVETSHQEGIGGLGFVQTNVLQGQNMVHTGRPEFVRPARIQVVGRMGPPYIFF